MWGEEFLFGRSLLEILILLLFLPSLRRIKPSTLVITSLFVWYYFFDY
jgi:hypothetical protein